MTGLRTGSFRIQYSYVRERAVKRAWKSSGTGRIQRTATDFGRKVFIARTQLSGERTLSV